ncbi:hypothetical protein HRbin11_01782 [bacterium HR11]|nr:hypothetical protein HRbin11_01782 [bacterium HR11]
MFQAVGRWAVGSSAGRATGVYPRNTGRHAGGFRKAPAVLRASQNPHIESATAQRPDARTPEGPYSPSPKTSNVPIIFS